MYTAMTSCDRCCFCLNSLTGSFLFGVALLMYYIALVAGSALQIYSPEVSNCAIRLTSTILLMLFSSLTVASTVLLFMGLCVESRRLMVPVVVLVGLTTVVELSNSFIYYRLSDQPFNDRQLIELICDAFICTLKLIGIGCVRIQSQIFYHKKLARSSNPKTTLGPFNLHSQSQSEQDFFDADSDPPNKEYKDELTNVNGSDNSINTRNCSDLRSESRATCLMDCDSSPRQTSQVGFC